jgi:hypothetical protein
LTIITADSFLDEVLAQPMVSLAVHRAALASVPLRWHLDYSLVRLQV